MSSAASSPPYPSEEARAVLRLLKENGNVLITGAPATGKTRLLQEVREGFKWTPGATYNRSARVAIPAVPQDVALWLPSPARTNREVFETAFHQNTKFGEVLRAREAEVGGAGGAGTTFRVSSGILYLASEHGLLPDGAALLIIDEINRGPAVSVFGPCLTALEFDKRLDDDGAEVTTTATFRLLDDNGDYIDYAFPTHLYVLAAMNQADTSIEALDVAFMRRWEPYQLRPDLKTLIDYFGLTDVTGELPDTPAAVDDVYRAAVRAWQAVNRRIRLGRGAEFEIGHGVFMRGQVGTTVDDALEHVRTGWRRVRQHLDEVFFGSVEGLAAALNVGSQDNPITLGSEMFANDSVSFLDEPPTPDNPTLYKILRAVAD